MSAKILVIDDEIEIRRLLQVGLTAHGYEVVEASTGGEGIHQAAAACPDVVILDMGLPDMEGLGVVSQIRQWSMMPIVILSVRGLDSDKVKALDEGADDYLTKPFSLTELMARIRVALRHQAHTPNEPILVMEELQIDLARRQVKLAGKTVELLPTEYDLLQILALNAGKVVTNRQLLTRVWGSDAQEYDQYLRTYINQLRKKIEKDPSQPRIILTEPGVGYRLAGLE